MVSWDPPYPLLFYFFNLLLSITQKTIANTSTFTTFPELKCHLRGSHTRLPLQNPRLLNSTSFFFFSPPAKTRRKCFMSSISSSDMKRVKMGKGHVLKPSKHEQVISLHLTYTTNLLQQSCSCTGWIFLDSDENTLLDEWQVRRKEKHENLTFENQILPSRLLWSHFTCKGGRWEWLGSVLVPWWRR